jgi:ribosomal subunit interface protein
MNVRVSGKQIEIGEALPVKVRERLETVIAKHFDGDADATVVFAHEGSGYRTDCMVHLTSGIVQKAEGVGQDVHAAFDDVMVHLEKQLRRYKRRLKNHHQKANTLKGAGA